MSVSQQFETSVTELRLVMATYLWGVYEQTVEFRNLTDKRLNLGIVRFWTYITWPGQRDRLVQRMRARRIVLRPGEAKKVRVTWGVVGYLSFYIMTIIVRGIFPYKLKVVARGETKEFTGEAPVVE